MLPFRHILFPKSPKESHFCVLSSFAFSLSLSLQEVTSDESGEESNAMNLMEFSDEILLHILRYTPVSDLVLNVRRVCRKLSVLSLDKSLTHAVTLHKDYQVRKSLEGITGCGWSWEGYLFSGILGFS